MSMAKWMGVTVLACALVAGCQREDNMGSGEGDEEGAVPSGTIAAPTDAPTSANPAAAGVPVDSTAMPAETTTAVVGK